MNKNILLNNGTALTPVRYSTAILSLSLLIFSGCATHQPFIYKGEDLKLEADRLIEPLGVITVEDLGDPQPKHPLRLKNVTPMTDAIWRAALENCEASLVEFEGKRYFAAGAEWGIRVYTRDISYGGILGANRIFPKEMMQTLKVTRERRRNLGFRVSNEHHVIHAIKAPWKAEGMGELAFLKKYRTNSYSRRTDDVVWLWCAEDLLLVKSDTPMEEWEWLYSEGKWFFENMYAPFFDKSDGLYWGQATYVDIGYSGYPMGKDPAFKSSADCVMIKALSTSSLYFQGLSVLARTARRLGKDEEAEVWRSRAEALQVSIIKALGRPDGTLACYKDKLGKTHDRREALGTAIAVLTHVVEGEDAKRAIATYPITEWGVPTFTPWLDNKTAYHNNASWPFVTALFMRALENATGEDYTDMHAALLARACRPRNKQKGAFAELINHRNGGKPAGRNKQLWSAAAYIDLCHRAGLLPDELSGPGSE
jgi:hypothetical protein